MKRSSILSTTCGLLLATAAAANASAAATAPGSPRLARRGTNPSCSTVVPLACGQTVSGSLVASDCTEPGPNGSVGSFFDDFYRFSATGGQQIAVSLASANFDTYLIIEDENGNPVIQDDDSGGGTNSQVSFTAPTTGTYFAVASSHAVNQVGTYSLTLGCSAAAPSTCTPTSTTLCLGAGNRFQVTARYSTPQQAGAAQVVKLTDDTGYLWFFSASNVETVLKVLDGCSLNSHYWFFAGGLTNVFTQITVTDTSTGFIRLYTNPQNEAFQPIQDTSSLPNCP